MTRRIVERRSSTATTLSTTSCISILQMRGLIRTLPPVKTLPAYTDLFLDVATKAMWVSISTFGDPSTILERRALDGTMQGTATLPPGLEIQQIRGDLVTAVTTDGKTGEQLLVTHRLAR